MRLKALLLLILTLLATSPAWSGQTRDPQEYFFQESFGDFQEELEMAKEEGKAGVMIFFEMDECPFCHRMKTTVLNLVAVQDYYRKHFRIIAVDKEGDVNVVDFDGTEMKAKDFAFKRHRVRATPVIAFFDLNGKRVFRYTGATKDPEEFLWMGEFVVDKQYEKTSFTKYKGEKNKQASQQ